MRIAVLFHAGERHTDPAAYVVHHLARYWREDGHEVDYLYGTRRFRPADLLLVHVNLSVVPAEYLRFAARYPRALNAGIADIRKTTISRYLVRPGDGWRGPVIVKSDLNYGGQPEERLGENWMEQRFPLWRRLARRAARLAGRPDLPGGWEDYEIYDRIEDVPPARLRSRHFVVERFRPEREQGLYHLRIYLFLGDRHSCSRLASEDPIVKAQNSVRVEPVEPHPAVVAWRESLGMDYGKLDYVVEGGEAVLLDANKTIGASPRMANADLAAVRRHLAEGLYAYTGRRRGADASEPARGEGDLANG
jgi:hypothetical protein